MKPPKENWLTYPVTGLTDVRIQIRGEATWPNVQKELALLGLSLSIENKRGSQNENS